MSAAVTGRAVWDAPAATRGRKHQGKHRRRREYPRLREFWRGFTLPFTLPVRLAGNWWRSYQGERANGWLTLAFLALLVACAVGGVQ